MSDNGGAIAKYIDIQLKPIRERLDAIENKMVELEKRPGFWKRLFGGSPVVTRADVERIVRSYLYDDEDGPRPEPE